MTRFALLVGLGLAVNCQSASVLWDCFTLTGSRDATGSGRYSLSFQYSPEGAEMALYPMVVFSTSKRGIISTLTAEAVIMAAYGDNWIQTRQGDVVGPENTTGEIPCFLHGAVSWVSDETLDLVGTSDYDIPVRGTGTVYLGFATINDYDSNAGDFSSGTTLYTKYYGWVELEVSPTSVTLGHSAIRLDGRPIIVGSGDAPLIPEPATHVLALLGSLLLFPRRRRMAVLAP